MTVDEINLYFVRKGYEVSRARIKAPPMHTPTIKEHEMFIALKSIRPSVKLSCDQPPMTRVADDVLEFWSTYHIGGSGLSIGIQKILRDMAAELLEKRNQMSENISENFEING